ncbi:MAG: phosphatidylglycerophosphatase A [Nitrososphaerota archaeon]|nr:adenosylcobinamide amidohydrolase [Nitrososphaerales archaeon]MDW8045272.1 phosphatidylglycerophosphatase A [Nitrososphaerota archaeon]
MDIPIAIDGIRGEIVRDTLIIRSEKPLKVLSSAPFNGGFIEARTIINHQVPKEFHHAKIDEYLEGVINGLHLPKPVVCLMTAVNIRDNISVSSEVMDGLIVTALVTSGLSYPATAGDRVAEEGAGTVNIIVLVDGNLTDSCMVNALMTAIEAKCAALRELDVRSRYSNNVATGTTSDAIVIACTRVGEAIHYAGSATILGMLIGKNVKAAVKESSLKFLGERTLMRRLEERGITLDDLVSTAMALYTPSEGDEDVNGDVDVNVNGNGNGNVSKILKDGLIEAMNDINVASFVMGAIRLQEDGEYGLIPNLPRNSFLKDPITLIADESIGLALANYIAGTWGVYNFLRYERVKPGIMAKAGPFLDDMIGGLVAGVFSKVMSRR